MGMRAIHLAGFVSLIRSDSDLASLVSSFLTPYVVPLFG